MEEKEGCFATIFGIILFILIGEILMRGITIAGDYIAIILMSILGAAFLGFIIMCIKGMKK